MAVDWNKPLQYRLPDEGAESIEFRGFYGKESHAILVVKFKNGTEGLISRRWDGRLSEDGMTRYDIVNVPEQTKTYQNLYLQPSTATLNIGFAYGSEDAAKRHYNRSGLKYQGTIVMTWEDAKLIKTELVNLS
jgi:hypothetical protein